jgi:hypothetical protein
MDRSTCTQCILTSALEQIPSCNGAAVESSPGWQPAWHARQQNAGGEPPPPAPAAGARKHLQPDATVLPVCCCSLSGISCTAPAAGCRPAGRLLKMLRCCAWSSMKRTTPTCSRGQTGIRRLCSPAAHRRWLAPACKLGTMAAVCPGHHVRHRTQAVLGSTGGVTERAKR